MHVLNALIKPTRKALWLPPMWHPLLMAKVATKSDQRYCYMALQEHTSLGLLSESSPGGVAAPMSRSCNQQDQGQGAHR